jgi:hypothetical protein
MHDIGRLKTACASTKSLKSCNELCLAVTLAKAFQTACTRVQPASWRNTSEIYHIRIGETHETTSLYTDLVFAMQPSNDLLAIMKATGWACRYRF